MIQLMKTLARPTQARELLASEEWGQLPRETALQLMEGTLSAMHRLFLARDRGGRKSVMGEVINKLPGKGEVLVWAKPGDFCGE